MRNLLILPLFLLLLSFETKDKGCLEMDIVILADLSGSVENYEPFVVEAVEAFVNKTDISEEGIRLGIIGFNDNPFIISPIYGDKEEIKNNIHSFDFSGHDLTNMTDALQLSLIELFKERQSVQKLLIIISDGAVSDRSTTRLTIEQLKAVNVGICAVLIRNSSSQNDFMKEISSGCYVETSYESLVTELAKMDTCL